MSDMNGSEKLVAAVEDLGVKFQSFTAISSKRQKDVEQRLGIVETKLSANSKLIAVLLAVFTTMFSLLAGTLVKVFMP